MEENILNFKYNKEAKYWREKYEEEKNANAKMLDENLVHAKQGIANALRFALSVQDDEKI